VEVETDLGTWFTYETPGHAPSHVCLYQPERRLLLSGDHLLGRVSLYYDVGWSPDPVGEFLSSLGVVEGLDARLCLPGHGRTFADVQAHIDANRALVGQRLERVEHALAPAPRTAFDALPEPLRGGGHAAQRELVADRRRGRTSATWRRGGRVALVAGADGAPDRWIAA
jgi:glyoxylase-like metal-dependent hydrolase (beta-lactamase superfamily II)